MATISLISAALAAIALSLGAGVIARLLHKPDLTGLLQWAGITAAGMVLLECARGFLVGQRRLIALASLSLMVGLGMLLIVPAMARAGSPVSMVISHGAVTLSSVLLCVLLAARLQLLPVHGAKETVKFLPLLREVWTYGVIQLGGLVSANVAGWWITAMVARGDTTLVQVSFFAIASQLRNLIGLVPALLTEGSFAAMAGPAEQGESVSHRVMMLCTYASTAVSFLIAAITAIVAPLLLQLMYGASYRSAALAVSVAVGVAVVQMGNAPPSARLSVVSIRATAIVNGVWALFTAAIGTAWMMHGGNAADAMGVFLAAHIVIAVMVLSFLRRRDRLPGGMVQLFAVSTLGIVLLCLLAAYRSSHPASALEATGLMTCVAVIATLLLYRLGNRHGCLPTAEALRQMAGRVTSQLGVRR
jgi:O-antigen/teichoic acid export membrane protein